MNIIIDKGYHEPKYTKKRFDEWKKEKEKEKKK